MPEDPSAVAAAAVAAAEAAAAQGDAVAEAAYQLSKQILEDGQFELLPALTALVAEGIAAGLAAYSAVAPAAQAANAQAQALYQQYVDELRRKL